MDRKFVVDFHPQKQNQWTDFVSKDSQNELTSNTETNNKLTSSQKDDLKYLPNKTKTTNNF